MKRALTLLFAFLLTVMLLAGCIKPAPGAEPWKEQEPTPTKAAGMPSVSAKAELPPTRDPETPYRTPTPDSPHTLPTLRADSVYYAVQPGDTLGYIASLFGLELESLIAANPGINPDLLAVGQVLLIPSLHPTTSPSDFKIIPDSELVFGPASATLDIDKFIREQNGFLEDYTEMIEFQTFKGSQQIERISREFSVNPRLLLALLEYRSGWVSSRQIDEFTRDYPMGYINEDYKGLYMQLAWAANLLNRGYYLWKISAISYTVFSDGTLALLSPTINAGTAGVQYMLGKNSTGATWQQAVSEDGVYKTYTRLFGIPFDRAVEPLLPEDLTQPTMSLPFEPGTEWAYTSGPHGGWGSGSAWAALDFAPPGDLFGCYSTDAWVTASADGVIIRADKGAVVLDLDGDGLEQTGWTILYMHIESRDRVKAGAVVREGDRIGHPSCEGGISDGTHVHIARRYNGEWISADTDLPFVMDGWVSGGTGTEYGGTLKRNGKVVWSWNGRVDDNQIAK